jgi:hypothetical protein
MGALLTCTTAGSIDGYCILYCLYVMTLLWKSSSLLPIPQVLTRTKPSLQFRADGCPFNMHKCWQQMLAALMTIILYGLYVMILLRKSSSLLPFPQVLTRTKPSLQFTDDGCPFNSWQHWWLLYCTGTVFRDDFVWSLISYMEIFFLII